MNFVSGIVRDFVSSTRVSVLTEVSCGLNHDRVLPFERRKTVKQGKKVCLLRRDHLRLLLMNVIVAIEIRVNEGKTASSLWFRDVQQQPRSSFCKLDDS